MSVICNTTSYNTDGVVGRMYPYYYDTFGNAKYDSTYVNIWDVTDVYGYELVMEEEFGDNNYFHQSTYAHEVGHALSLNHPASGSAIMRQGWDGVQYTVPQTLDKTNLKTKWGY